MSPKKPPAITTKIEEHRLKGKRRGAVLKEQVWFEDGKITHYSLAYINLNQCSVDHGRVLGYDNSHNYHHRHCMGKVESVQFTSYTELVERFIEEVHELWRIEDAKD